MKKQHKKRTKQQEAINSAFWQLSCFSLTLSLTLFMTNLSHKLCVNEVNLDVNQRREEGYGVREEKDVETFRDCRWSGASF